MSTRYLRYLASLIVVLGLGPISFGQVKVKIRMVNTENGHPIQKQPISVSMLYDKNEKTPPKYDSTIRLETDANGEAQFGLPDPAPAHLSAQVHLTSENWRCGCVVLVSTEDLLQKGASSPQFAKGSDKAITTEPREILFVARPYTFFERLIAPFVRE